MRERGKAMQGRGMKKALKKRKCTKRKCIGKTEDVLCSVSLEILEVTSLSAKLLRQTSKNTFQGREMRPYTIRGVYINVSLANPIRLPDGVPGDLAVSTPAGRFTLTERGLSAGPVQLAPSICLNRVLT